MTLDSNGGSPDLSDLALRLAAKYDDIVGPLEELVSEAKVQEVEPLMRRGVLPVLEYLLHAHGGSEADFVAYLRSVFPEIEEA